MSWLSMGAITGEASILEAVADLESSSTGPKSPQANAASAARSSLRMLNLADQQLSGLVVPSLWSEEDLGMWGVTLKAAGENVVRAERLTATISGSAQLLLPTSQAQFAKAMGVNMALTKQVAVMRKRLEDAAARMPDAPDLPPTSIRPAEPEPRPEPYRPSLSVPGGASAPLLLVAGLVMGAAGLALLFGGRR